MPSIARRAITVILTSTTLAQSVPAAAQADRSAIVLNILVECAKIDDPAARLACYDNNIRGAGGPVRNTIPGQVRGVEGGAAAVETQGPQGFGYEQVRAADPSRFRPAPGQLQEIHSKVASVAPREPGVYLVTLEDGAQWLFAEGVSSQFRVPRRGTTVEIERGSLGSFLMRVDGQAPVLVRRIR